MTRHISLLLIAVLFSLSFCAHSHAAGPALIPIERDKALDLLPMGIGTVEKAKPSVRVGIRREEITASAMAKKEPLVMITEPRAGSVNRAYQRVSGRLGGGITKAYVRINGETQAVTAQGGQFTFFTALLPGLNTITALGWDLDGNLGKDSITVFLDPAAEGGVAEITSPKDGTTVDTTGQRVITVLARASADAVEAVLVQGIIPRRVGIKGGRVSQDVALGLRGESLALVFFLRHPAQLLFQKLRRVDITIHIIFSWQPADYRRLGLRCGRGAPVHPCRVDIDQVVIAKAEAGIYGGRSVSVTPPQLLERYFRKEGNDYRVKEVLRRLTSFRQVNLLEFADHFAEDSIDIIFCRNVIIYFDRPTQGYNHFVAEVEPVAPVPSRPAALRSARTLSITDGAEIFRNGCLPSITSMSSTATLILAL